MSRRDELNELMIKGWADLEAMRRIVAQREKQLFTWADELAEVMCPVKVGDRIVREDRDAYGNEKIKIAVVTRISHDYVRPYKIEARFIRKDGKWAKGEAFYIADIDDWKTEAQFQNIKSGAFKWVIG